MVSENGSNLVLDGQCVDHAFMLVSYVFSMLEVHICLLYLCCVGHGGSGVTTEVLMVLLSTCCHECMTGYGLLALMYFSCMCAYIFLHIVYALLVYIRSHVGPACVLSIYAFLCVLYVGHALVIHDWSYISSGCIWPSLHWTGEGCCA